MKFPLVRRKRSRAFPVDPAQDDSQLGELGLDLVPLPSQELAIDVHRWDRGRKGSSFAPCTPRPQTAPSQESGVPAELGASRVGCQQSWVPAQLGAILSGCSGLWVELGGCVSTSVADTASVPPVPEPPPHPIPKHPSEELTRGRRPQPVTRRTAHPRSREVSLDSPPSPGQPLPLGYPVPPGSQLGAPARVPGREVPSSGRAPGPVRRYLARAAAGGGRPVRPVPAASRSLHSGGGRGRSPLRREAPSAGRGRRRVSGGMGGHRDRDQSRQDLGSSDVATEGLRHPPAPRPFRISLHPLVTPLLPRISPFLSPP